MEQSSPTSDSPSAWTWILGTILVIAILWAVFATISRTGGSGNERLPRAQIRAGSMVAGLDAGYPAPFSSASNSV